MSDESHTARDARIDLGVVLSTLVKRAPRIIFVTFVLLVITYVILMFTPRLYESTAGILVEPRTNVFASGAVERAPVSGGEAGVVSSQIELIKSRDTLLRVIEETDLRSVPEFAIGGSGFSPVAIIRRLLGQQPEQSSGDAIVLANLLDRMSVIQQRDSRVITVSVRSRDPDLAAKLANAVASAHVARRAELSLIDTANASGWLLEEIEKLRVSVEDAERAVANFRVENDLFTGSNNTSLLDQQLSTIAGQINAAQERKNTATSRAELIRSLIDEGRSIEGVPDIQESGVIQQLTQERAQLQGERAQLAATLLPNHPSIRAINAQIAELDAQIRIEGRQVAAALEAEAEIEADLEASLREDLETLKVSASEATREGVTLQGLVREADAQRDLLESYLRRYNEAVSRTDAESVLPDVRVITVAAPAVRPAWPQTTMILLAVGIVSVVTQVGIIIFAELISGRAIREPVREPVAGDRFEQAPFAQTAVPVEPEVVVADTDDEIFEDEQTTAFEPEPVPVAEIVPLDPPANDETSLEADEDFNELIEAARYRDFDADLADAEPTPEPEEEEPLAAPPAVEDHRKLSSDLALGRSRVVVLAGLKGASECDALADVLTDELLDRGVSVAIIDAGSGRSGDEPGIADLSLGEASFGDVVHKSPDNGFALVPWGQSEAFDIDSMRPSTLIEALSDIYEVVIISTGRAGTESTLPAFEGLADRLVLVAANEDDRSGIAALHQEFSAAGYGQVEIVQAPSLVAA